MVKKSSGLKKSYGLKRLFAALLNTFFVLLHIDPTGIGSLVVAGTGALGLAHGVATGTIKKYLIGTLAALIGITQAFPALHIYAPLFQDVIVLLGGAAVGEAIGRNTNVAK